MTTKQEANDPFRLSRSIIAIPLLQAMEAAGEHQRFNVIIDVNLDYREGRSAARKTLIERLRAFEQPYSGPEEPEVHPQYIFANLTAEQIRRLVRNDLEIAREDARLRLIYKIWPDFEVTAFLTKSVRTVKADAANISFSANGSGIRWAVIDTGIDSRHHHFTEHKNLDTPYSKDFTQENGDAFSDDNGHGTHVAGIIAGALRGPIYAAQSKIDEDNEMRTEVHEYPGISGVAPLCKLISLKVLNDQGKGLASTTLRAIHHIQEINGFGRDIKIHGVNISIGHSFEPEWFACGQSPLCVEVDRLVKSGVVVVVAAGNSGYGLLKSVDNKDIRAGISLSITDPGNANLAITVGSTHRDMPHVYGVSYFSSKGPTGDGRLKPDLIAPGEKIVSCAVGLIKSKLSMRLTSEFGYCEVSGTSMAAPHVSGAIAAFLSIRQEFIGRPEQVKEVFLATATDLKRDRYFQGNGLVDLMRAIQSV